MTEKKQHSVIFDFAKDIYIVDGRPIELTATQHRMLRLLYESRPKVISREELAGDRVEGNYDAALAKNIERLRDLFPDRTWIEVVRGRGFRWKDLSRVDIGEAATNVLTDSEHRQDDEEHSGDGDVAESDSARAFYSGGPSKPAHIMENFDITRTQYAGSNGDEVSWRTVLQKRVGERTGGLHIFLLLGPAGSGKSTLAHRIVVDAIQAGYSVEDALTDPRALPPVELLKARPSVRARHSLFVTKIHSANNGDEAEYIARWATKVSQLNIAATLIIVCDTNKWRPFEERFLRIARIERKQLTTWLLNHRLDDKEIEQLVDRLRQHDALRARSNLSNDEVVELFRKRANNGLLTSLIEVTRGSSERETLSEILLWEFRDLPQQSQWAHLVVALSSSRQARIANRVLGEILHDLTHEFQYFGSPAFVLHLADVIIRDRTGGWRSRHSILANSLITSVREIFPLTIERALLSLLQISARTDATLFECLVRRKVLTLLPDFSMQDRVVLEAAGMIDNSYLLSVLYNQHARELISGARYRRALDFLDKSTDRFPASSNPASYLRAYAFIRNGQQELAHAIATSLVGPAQSLEHLYHATVLLAMARDADAARNARDMYAQVAISSRTPPDELSELDRRITELLRTPTVPTTPKARLNAILLSAETHPFGIELIDEASQLLAELPSYDSIVLRVSQYYFRMRASGFDDDATRAALRYLEKKWRSHLHAHESGERQYSKRSLARLHAGCARARMLQVERSALSEESLVAISEELQRSLDLFRDEPWVKLWLSEIEFRLGHCDRSIHLAREARALAPENELCSIAVADRLLHQPAPSIANIAEAEEVLVRLVPRTEPLSEANSGGIREKTVSYVVERSQELLQIAAQLRGTKKDEGQ